MALVNATPTAEHVLPPSKDPWYEVPQNVDDVPVGTILRHRRPPSPIAAFSVAPISLKASHQILYKTLDSLNSSTATALTVLIPNNADFGKVLSYQFAEDSSSLDCAPSYFLQLFSVPGGPLGSIIPQADILLVEAALDRGWVVIVPDHQGPISAFLSNGLAGHAVLDGIRAATRSTRFTGIEPDPTVVLWGYSGGSLASGWAAELYPSYAPELNIVGAALGGTVPNINNVMTSVKKGPFAGLLLAGLLGLAHQYKEIDDLVQKHLLPSSRPAFERVDRQCLTRNFLQFAFKDIATSFDDPAAFTRGPLTSISHDNDLGHLTPQIPLYIYKSVLDEVSPIADTDDLVENYCANGASVEYIRDLASAHGILSVTGAAKAMSWLVEAMEGNQQGSGCSTRNVVSSLLDPSAAVIPGFLRRSLLNLLGRPLGSSEAATVEMNGASAGTQGNIRIFV